MRIESTPPCLAATLAPTSPQEPRRAFRDHLGSHRSAAFGPDEARQALREAWRKVVGEAPRAATTELLTAHWAVETDSGRAMPGYNFAGIKAGPKAPGAAYPTVEGHGATRREVVARFRVYDSAQAGAADYVRLLRSRFPAALEAARSGDCAAFAHELAVGGYFTAAPRAYASSLAWHLAALSTRSAMPLPPPAALTHSALAGLLHAFRRSEEDT